MSDDRYSIDEFELYRMARAFRIKVYALTKQLPHDEKYVLGVQMRRAALSVSNNIAEGHGRWFYQDNARFCRFTRGSVEEIIDDLNTCLDERYLPPEIIIPLKQEALLLVRRLNSYIGYLKRSQQGKNETQTPRHSDT
jgi:four helix bundle protein